MCAECSPDDDAAELREHWPQMRQELLSFARLLSGHGNTRAVCLILAAVALADVGAAAGD